MVLWYNLHRSIATPSIYLELGAAQAVTRVEIRDEGLTGCCAARPSGPGSWLTPVLQWKTQFLHFHYHEDGR